MTPLSLGTILLMTFFSPFFFPLNFLLYFKFSDIGLLELTCQCSNLLCSFISTVTFLITKKVCSFSIHDFFSLFFLVANCSGFMFVIYVSENINDVFFSRVFFCLCSLYQD